MSGSEVRAALYLSWDRQQKGRSLRLPTGLTHPHHLQHPPPPPPPRTLKHTLSAAEREQNPLWRVVEGDRFWPGRKGSPMPDNLQITQIGEVSISPGLHSRDGQTSLPQPNGPHPTSDVSASPRDGASENDSPLSALQPLGRSPKSFFAGALIALTPMCPAQGWTAGSSSGPLLISGCKSVPLTSCHRSGVTWWEKLPLPPQICQSPRMGS